MPTEITDRAAPEIGTKVRLICGQCHSLRELSTSPCPSCGNASSFEFTETTEDVIKKLIDYPIQLGITPIHHMRVIQLSWKNWSGRSTAPDYLSITREIVEEGVND